MNEQEQLISQLNSMIEKPGGKQAARLLLNALGAIPFLGGAIAGTGNLWGEMEQQNFNEAIVKWLSNANQDINQVLSFLSEQMQDPTKAHLAILIGEISGIDVSDYTEGLEISLILNNDTVSELQPFVKKGWIKLQSNGNTVNMGAGNRIGNSIEDLKRPWGMDIGFIVTIYASYFIE